MQQGRAERTPAQRQSRSGAPAAFGVDRPGLGQHRSPVRRSSSLRSDPGGEGLQAAMHADLDGRFRHAGQLRAVSTTDSPSSFMWTMGSRCRSGSSLEQLGQVAARRGVLGSRCAASTSCSSSSGSLSDLAHERAAQQVHQLVARDRMHPGRQRLAADRRCGAGCERRARSPARGPRLHRASWTRRFRKKARKMGAQVLQEERGRPAHRRQGHAPAACADAALAPRRQSRGPCLSIRCHANRRVTARMSKETILRELCLGAL